MPNLTRFLIINALIGFAVAVIFVAIIIKLNIANLDTLISNSDSGLFAVVVLTFFMGQTFAGIQVGLAIMLASTEDDDDKTGGYKDHIRAWFLDPKPIPIAVEKKRLGSN